MHTIAIDLGGTNIKIGLVEQGRVAAQGSIPANAADGLGPQLDRISGEIDRLAQSIGIDPRRCRGIGMGIPTLIDPYQQRVRSTIGKKFPDIMTVDLPGWAKGRFGLPLRFDNDAHVALLGEWRHGAGKGCDDLVMVTLGTGIGTSALLRGRPLRGRHGSAGNLGGHYIGTPHGRPCHCGANGCIETECASPDIARIARADPRFASSALAKEPQLDFAAIFRLAPTDELAAAMRDRALTWWGVAMVNLIHSFDPTRVIIGGGIMRSADVILPPLQNFTDNNTWTPAGEVQLVAAALGDQAALLGIPVLFDEALEFI